MLRYDLSKLTTRKAGTSIVLPAVPPAIGPETSYVRALRVMLREFSAWTGANIVPAYEAALVRHAHDHRITADVDAWSFREMDDFASRLIAVAEGMVGRILKLEAQRHTKQFMAVAKRAIGVDLSAVVREDDLSGDLDRIALRNANLIAGLAQDTVKRIKDRTIQAVLTGEGAPSFRKTLVKEFKIADNRARVIARDQIGKLNSDLNRLRHQQAGITEYIWTTAHDERVRERHKALDGKRYVYGEPTGAEDGLPPGQPIQCRCVARAVVEF